MRDRTGPLDMKALMEEAAGRPVELPWGPVHVIVSGVPSDFEQALTAEMACERCYPTMEWHVVEGGSGYLWAAVVMHFHAREGRERERPASDVSTVREDMARREPGTAGTGALHPGVARLRAETGRRTSRHRRGLRRVLGGSRHPRVD
jgi:hypothetical protein